MMCDSWWQLQRQICVLAIQTMKSRYSKIIICNLWIEKFDWSFHGMKSEGWASFSCDQGRAGPLGHRAHRCGAHWETLPVVVPLSTMQCSASSDTDQSHVGHTITCHHQCHNTIMQSVIHFTMQHCTAAACLQQIVMQWNFKFTISASWYAVNNDYLSNSIFAKQ